MDILAKLISLTNDDSWEPINGPESGSGTDYWWENADSDEAYANMDQGYIKIALNGEPLWEGEDEEDDYEGEIEALEGLQDLNPDEVEDEDITAADAADEDDTSPPEDIPDLEDEDIEDNLEDSE